MTPAVLGLATLTLLLALLLLGLNVRARWPLALKAGVTLLSFIVLAVGYLSLHRLLGWPASTDPAPGARLIAAEIREPAKNGDAGAVYLWLAPPDASAPPRAHALPYSQALHQAVVEALRRKTAGEELRMREGGAASYRGEFGRERAIGFESVDKPRLPAKE